MDKCNHTYKPLDSQVTKYYGDNSVHSEVVEATFYCEKCLDIVTKRKVIEEW
ncbi:hypothetical protein GCM10007971_37170 [Oceanobacillus indicireducens]|uniref:Uncharacterized protein n=1 Tax=Oceanobacillus indicireducens TaxID=1004261 RepID=A0A918D4M1_9BACI|nr:hypothetical protein GCM10007971_37170 [Oceanobacillus indicireducens]